MLTPDTLPPALAPKDTEEQVIGACLTSADAAQAARQVLTAADFAWSHHGEIFTACCALADAGTPLDTFTVRAELERRGTLAGVGGMGFLGYLSDTSLGAEFVREYAALVRAAAQRRRLYALAERLADAAEDPATDLTAVSTQVAGELLPIATDGDADGFRPAEERLYPVLETIEQRMLARRLGRTLGITTGYPELDEIFHGFRPGEFIVVGAGPKMGKSALALNILRHVAETETVGIVSAEMTRDEIVEALLSLESGIPRGRIAAGALGASDMADLARASQAMRGAMGRLQIDDVAFPSLEHVVSRSIRLKAEHPALAFLVVDYLQLVTNPMKGRRGDEEISAVCIALKGLAKRLGVPVLAPAQVNYKTVDKREEKRPTLADLQGSSGMAQTANVVLLLHRPQSSGFGDADNTLSVEIAASRRTERRQIELGWDGARMRVLSRRPRLMPPTPHTDAA